MKLTNIALLLAASFSVSSASAFQSISINNNNNNNNNNVVGPSGSAPFSYNAGLFQRCVKTGMFGDLPTTRKGMFKFLCENISAPNKSFYSYNNELYSDPGLIELTALLDPKGNIQKKYEDAIASSNRNTDIQGIFRGYQDKGQLDWYIPTSDEYLKLEELEPYLFMGTNRDNNPLYKPAIASDGDKKCYYNHYHQSNAQCLSQSEGGVPFLITSSLRQYLGAQKEIHASLSINSITFSGYNSSKHYYNKIMLTTSNPVLDVDAVRGMDIKLVINHPAYQDGGAGGTGSIQRCPENNRTVSLNNYPIYISEKNITFYLGESLFVKDNLGSTEYCSNIFLTNLKDRKDHTFAHLTQRLFNQNPVKYVIPVKDVDYDTDNFPADNYTVKLEK